MEQTKGLTIKSLLIRLILIIIFIFLLIWLFPMPNLKPLNNQIFADNVDRMKEVAKSYYTTERLPQNIGDYKKMTLKEMEEKNLILPLMDSKGKYCSKTESYVKIEKMENEYLITVYLSCSDKKATIKEHFGCYDICSDTCKALEVAATSGTTTYRTTLQSARKTARKTTRQSTVWSTTKKGKIYEYEFVKNVCTDVFDKYVCDAGYVLVGNSCMKDDTEIEIKDAQEHKSIISSVDTVDAKAVETSETETKDANMAERTVTSTINAGYTGTVYSADLKTVTRKLTANSVDNYDIKGAVSTTKTTTYSYKEIQTYDVVDADITYPNAVKESGWKHTSTKVTLDGSLAFNGANEKLVLVETWQEPACPTCQDSTKMVTWYMYYRYKLVESTDKGTPVYTCDSHPGYTLQGTKCKKAGKITRTCPDSSYTDTGSGCQKKETTYSCSKYGSDYKYNSSNNTCVKTTTKYSCSEGKLVDTKYCEVTTKDYVCPDNMVKNGSGSNTTCTLYNYYCPSNTATKTYTLNGSKCTVLAKVKVASCDDGYTLSADKTKCIKDSTITTYTCDHLDGYTLHNDKCTKVINTETITYTCDQGYTLDGQKCYKTVHEQDTKAATKTYKTICEQKYKWSTSTSVDGWSYTGNKRQVNY